MDFDVLNILKNKLNSDERTSESKKMSSLRRKIDNSASNIC